MSETTTTTLKMITDVTTAAGLLPNDTQSSNGGVKQQVDSGGDALTSSYLFIGLVALATFILLLILFAIYKYRNRDEGTYRIDESKNCGPFAELQTPLNHVTGGSGGMLASGQANAKGNSKKVKRMNNPNKEWYV
jgi:hypothetical protein